MIRHHVIIRHHLAYPPPPPPVMTSFMNSPLIALQVISPVRRIENKDFEASPNRMVDCINGEVAKVALCAMCGLCTICQDSPPLPDISAKFQLFSTAVKVKSQQIFITNLVFGSFLLTLETESIPNITFCFTNTDALRFQLFPPF